MWECLWKCLLKCSKQLLLNFSRLGEEDQSILPVPVLKLPVSGKAHNLLPWMKATLAWGSGLLDEPSLTMPALHLLSCCISCAAGYAYRRWRWICAESLPSFILHTVQNGLSPSPLGLKANCIMCSSGFSYLIFDCLFSGEKF